MTEPPTAQLPDQPTQPPRRSDPLGAAFHGTFGVLLALALIFCGFPVLCFASWMVLAAIGALFN